MKISMLGTLPPLKGISYYCWNLSRALAPKVELEFFTFRTLYPEFLYPGGTKASGLEKVLERENRFSAFSTLSIYNPLSWIKTAFRISGDVVHAHLWSMPVVPVWILIFALLKRRHKKIVITIHNVLPHESSRFDKMMTKIVLRFADRFIVHAERNIDDLDSIFHISRDRVSRVPMGPHYTYQPGKIYDTAEAKKELGIDIGAKVLLQFGNIREYKGVDDFIRALALVKQSYRGKVIGLIVGQPWKSFEKYEKLITQLGLSENIKTYLSYIPDTEVSKYFYASDIAVLAYKEMKGQSAVGHIAVDMGLPMVVTNTGGLPDLVFDKNFVVEPERPDLLAEKITEILQDDRVAEKLKKDTAEIQKANSWDRISDMTVELYKTMVSV